MMFNDLFNRSIEEQKPLSLMKSSDSDDFWFGVVSDFNEDVVEVRLFDSYGEFDGYVITPADSIYGIEYDDEYEMTTAYLIAENSFMTHIPDSKVKLKGNNWTYHTLLALMNLKIPIEVSMDEETKMGYVERVELEAFEMRLFDSFGDSRGRIFCSHEELEHVRYLSKKIKKSALLFEWRATKNK
jgi:hypothetical protein